MTLRKTLCLSFALLLTVASVGPALAITCFNSFGFCSATTTVVDYDDEPTVPCPNGWDVVEVTSSAICQGGGAGPAVALRCGAFNEPLVYSGNGKVHKVQPSTNWQDVLDGDCRKLLYKNMKS